MNGPVIATLAVGVIAPFIAVLFGVLLSNQRIARLETTLDARLLRMETMIEAFRNEMIALRNSIHADMVGIHERVAKVETRQGL